jgi:hypothetical protein
MVTMSDAALHKDTLPAQKSLSFSERLTQKLTMRRRKWTGGTWLIKQSQIFILPNRYGIYAGFLVLASFAMGYKVQNNFILLGVIFLFLVFMLSLIASVRNIQGLRVDIHLEPYYFADGMTHIRLALRKDQPAFNLTLSGPMGDMPLDLSGGATSILVPVGALARGVYEVPPLKIQTLFPFGIARAWSWLRPPGDIVMAPAPAQQAAQAYPRGHPAAAHQAQAAAQKRQQNNFADELGDLRDYGPSDPPARIDWKRYAATRETMVRDHGLDTQGEMILRQPTGDLETGLSYLSGGLLVAERIGAPVRMRLDGADYQIYDKPAREKAFYALARTK